MANRTPRENETRSSAERPNFWQPPNLLPDPNPKEGVVYRWIRTATLGQSDSPNVSTRFREGWEPVPAADVPELQLVPDKNSRFPGNVEVGGLLLCRNSVENVEARNEYYRNLARQQIEAADNQLMRENDPRMPLHVERNSQVSFGSGRPR
jgi:hypothetical protein